MKFSKWEFLIFSGILITLFECYFGCHFDAIWGVLVLITFLLMALVHIALNKE